MVQGKLDKLDAVQSNIEAGVMYHDVLNREAELANVVSDLHFFVLLTATIRYSVLIPEF